MKKFTFPLERIRAWNATRLQLEEVALEAILDERRRAEETFAQIRNQQLELQQTTLRKTEVEVTELVRMEQGRLFVAIEGRRHYAARAQFEKQIAECRARMIEIRRKIELLDRLKERQHEAWTAEETKELQAAADEAFLQKLVVKRNMN